jgi:urease accessory protein
MQTWRTIMTPEALLAALHLGDSAFPSGAFAFSWGLEGLAADGLVTAEADLALLLEDLFVNRWRSFDRIALRRVYQIAEMMREVSRLVSLDLEVEAATWAAPLRAGSKRAGRALLNAHARLGSGGLRAYRSHVAGDPRLGHLAVAQGVAWRSAGLALDVAEALGAWAMASSIAAAAVRLGVVGHLGAQAVLAHARTVAAEILRETPDPTAPLYAFTPLVDVALMRHDHRDLRLFAT